MFGIIGSLYIVKTSDRDGAPRDRVRARVVGTAGTTLSIAVSETARTVPGMV